MMSGKNQSGQAPTAFGSMLQASTSGMTIPVIYGRTQSPLLAIWANNLRQGGSVKKFKQMKKGITAYCENIDFLLGVNPILGVLQFWANNSKYPLASTSYAVASGSSAITIPDTHFYAVLGVTITANYSETFNDYGAAGSSTVTGSYEIPLWNSLFAGPDPTDASGQRNWPYCYRWEPSYGATIYLDGLAVGSLPAGTVTVYYAQLMAATSYLPPASKLRLSFENVLGSGTEYAGYESERIEYPFYSGLGSDSLDLGASGAIPSIKPETQGKFGIYPTGDCDFVDIIEDVLKSGITQTAIGGTLGFGATQQGVGCYTYPGCVQKKGIYTGPFFSAAAAFDLPNTAGNMLVVWADRSTSGSLTISDTLGNTYVQAFSATRTEAGNFTGTIWYCENCLAGTNAVTISGGGASNSTTAIFELAGVDTFDGVASGIGVQPQVSLTTTNAPGQAGVLLAFSAPIVPPSSGLLGSLSLWPQIMEIDGTFGDDIHPLVQQRNISNPGTFSLRWQMAAGVAHSYLVMLAFKAAQPATYPKPLADFLDAPSRELTRMQCRAAGLWGSLAMTSQKPASDWIKDLVAAANCAPVWSGMRLKLIPMSEVSAVGNGAVYIAPTASGPVANLDADAGDFIAAKGEAAIAMVRTARTDLDTVVQMQHINRDSDYQQMVTAESDPASIALYGVRKADPTVNNAIQDASVARPLLRIAVRRQNYVENQTYKFKLNARWQLLEPMDLITVTDREQGIIQLPVRLTSVEEDNQFNLSCEAEPFIYGISAPQTLAVTQPAPYRPSPDAGAGSVNAPIIFEPVPRQYGATNQPELWLVVSSSNAAYGGCQVMISTDGGSSYNSAGDPIAGNGVTGATVGSWAAAASPDTTNDLAVDLTESLGVLSSYQVADEDNFVYPCYVAGGAGSIPFELMSYAIATMTAANRYTLKATGTGSHLNRGVFGAPTLNTGVAHTSGSRFALLQPDGTGILKLRMDPLWVGKTLYFKILSFNSFGGAVQQLSDATAYSYTPTGGSGSVNPGGAPVQGYQINGA